ncbi:MAG: SWIM zinc finger family protein [Bacteroidota bacterium]
MNFTEEQVLALAPDESSKKAGRDLANPSKWVSKGFDEHAMWGECQGSGSKPYQTQVDLGNIAFKCSCPSRKFPCKHGLGLLMLHVKQPALFAVAEQPAWVKEWLSKRTETAEKKAEKKEAPVDEAAQAKRAEARQKSVENGIEELLLWMKDIVRNGILTIPEKGPGYFANMAKRMIDAKAPGLAVMVKELGNCGFYNDGWQSDFMDQLGDIYMVIKGFQNKEGLPESLLQDLRSRIGFTQNQDELKEQAGVTDTWLVLGKQVSEEDNITTERNWLYGTQTKHYALVLQFSVRGQGVAISLTPGIALNAELVFFPSTQPLRAIIKTQTATNQAPLVNGFTDWLEVAAAETKRNAIMPLQTIQPFVVENITPVFSEQDWWLADAQNNRVQIPATYKNIYPLLAVSGGRPLTMAVIGGENHYEPLGIWEGDQYVSM